jgi:uncharacterized membrane protein (DUF485 family)
MVSIFDRAWKEIKKQTFSFVGSVVSLIFYVYNLLKPTNVSIAQQSAFGSVGGTIAIGVGTLAIIALIIFVGIWIYRDRYPKHKR